MKNIITLLLIVAFGYLSAQTIPDGYYDGTESLVGEALKLKLHQISRGHTKRSYGEFRDTILPDLDEDPDNDDNIILFYKNVSIPKQNFASNNEPDFWNREHTWPSSHGFSDDSDTAYTDVHNLRPADVTVNVSKSNKDFHDIEDSETNAEGEAPDTFTDDDFFEPRDEIKGDVARILFYMDMRYESKSLDLSLMDRKTYTGDNELGVLRTLIKWHEEDPVDQYEIDRHEKAYGYQGNRNPFIDHPEWVADIYGSSYDPYLVIDELNFATDFGTVAVGESFVQQYTLRGNNLTSDIQVSVEVPFELSVDGETYSNSISLAHTEGEVEETFTIYIKFSPSEESGASYTQVVTHSSEGANDVTMEVEGTEGTVNLISIAEARTMDLGSVVYVTGVVIDEGNNSSSSRVIYDGTAGIVVRSFDAGNESGSLVYGDSVVVSGGLSEYNNLLQIEQSPIVISLIAQNVAVPDAKVVTISEIGEELESQLVTIKNVQFEKPGLTFAGGGSAGNFNIYDPTGSLILRIGSSSHPLVGTLVPEGEFSITGFVGQFGSDYQLSPRSKEDLVSAGSGTVLDVPQIGVVVYPNPVSSTIQLNIDSYSTMSYTLTDLNGRIVKSGSVQNRKIDMSEVSKGTYVLGLRIDGSAQYTRVIVK